MYMLGRYIYIHTRTTLLYLYLYLTSLQIMSSRIRSFSKLVLELDSALKAFQSSDAKFRVLKTVYPPSRSRPPRSGKSGVRGYGDVTTTTTTTIPSALSSRGEGGEKEEGEEEEEEEEYEEDLSSPLPPPKTLFILDSSFNPPSIAHAALAQSAFVDDCNSSSSQPSQPSQQQKEKKQYEFPHRLLLLFAVTNADKIAAPASFEHRLAMMTCFARDLQDSFAGLREKQKGKEQGQQKEDEQQHKDENENEEQKEKQQHPMAIDIGVTKYPFYTDKSRAIESEGYPTHPRHIHLLGYDTLTRIFTAKYYIQQDFDPPFVALQPYFDKGYELRVTLRPDSTSPSPSAGPASSSSSSVEKEKEKEDQKEDQKTSFLSNLTNPQGEMQKNGAQANWARQIEFVSPQHAEMGVSSTRIREAVGKGEWEIVRELCTLRVARWVEREGLYLG